MLAPYSETARSKLSAGSGTSSALASTSGNVDARLALAAAGGLELGRRDVDADRARAAPREPGRDVRGAAAELDDVEPVDVPERVERRLGHAEDAPGDLLRAQVALALASVYSAFASSSPRGCASRRPRCRSWQRYAPRATLRETRLRQGRRGRTARARASRSPSSPSRARCSPRAASAKSPRIVPGAESSRVRRAHHRRGRPRSRSRRERRARGRGRR